MTGFNIVERFASVKSSVDMKKLLRKGSFAISPADHIYCDFSRELHCLELNVSNTHLINLEVHKYIKSAKD